MPWRLRLSLPTLFDLIGFRLQVAATSWGSAAPAPHEALLHEAALREGCRDFVSVNALTA